ncbi:MULTISPECIES: response regulator [Zobellia]|uniref:response regulator n=1 Tax=Zobellia TaxID=112040 RepID=UPI001C07CDC3|nr:MULTISPECIES: response regulator [unclassified Zobellia]MBU2976010.1 response regulator [Zobellia sp. B3R18]MDO6819825.1 response regulator [Zobellia sp. 1_MG-2023]
MIKSIVLVDDNNATNFIHETYLRRVNCAERVYSFTMGKKALEHLMNSKVFPELIFVDINMPTMDAWEFMELYKELDVALKINTRVILLTTSIIPSDKEKMEMYPEIDAMMYKPLNELAIKQIMVEHFNLTL